MTLRLPTRATEREGRARRNLYLVAMTLGLFAGALLVAVAEEGEFVFFRSFYETLVPLVLAVLASLLLLLWLRPSSLHLVERLLLLLQCAFSLGVVAQITYIELIAPIRDLIEMFLVWSPVLLAWAFLVFSRHDAFKVALLFIASVLGLGLPYLLGLVPPPAGARRSRHPSVHHLSHREQRATHHPLRPQPLSGGERSCPSQSRGGR